MITKHISLIILISFLFLLFSNSLIAQDELLGPNSFLHYKEFNKCFSELRKLKAKSFEVYFNKNDIRSFLLKDDTTLIDVKFDKKYVFRNDGLFLILNKDDSVKMSNYRKRIYNQYYDSLGIAIIESYRIENDSSKKLFSRTIEYPDSTIYLSYYFTPFKTITTTKNYKDSSIVIEKTKYFDSLNLHNSTFIFKYYSYENINSQIFQIKSAYFYHNYKEEKSELYIRIKNNKFRKNYFSTNNIIESSFRIRKIKYHKKNR